MVATSWLLWHACSRPGPASDLDDTSAVEDGDTHAETGGASTSDPADSSVPFRPNILWVVLDDVGTETLASYGAVGDTATTPTLDALGEQSVVFEQAWVAPTCSPTRASLLTGLHPEDHGIGVFIDHDGEVIELDPELPTLPALLTEAGYASALFGKWHLASCLVDEPASHPLRVGFQHASGSIGSTGMACTEGPDGVEADYFVWEKAVDGAFSWVEAYQTSDTVDDALAWIAGTPAPWFAMVSFNAAHWPWHVPPGELNSAGVAEGASDVALYHADVEALDTELGRLLEDVPPETWLFVIGDNGTDDDVIVPPYAANRAKGTLYDGGVRVPLWIAGPGIAAGRTASLVQGLDLYATSLEVAGVHADHQAAVSLLPVLADPGLQVRDRIYASTPKPNGATVYTQHHQALRDGEHKLVRRDLGSRVEEQLFRYEEGALDEGDDLLQSPLDAAGTEALERLRAELAAKRSSPRP